MFMENRKQHLLQPLRLIPQRLHFRFSCVRHTCRRSEHVDVQIGEGTEHQLLNALILALPQIVQQRHNGVDV